MVADRKENFVLRGVVDYDCLLANLSVASAAIVAQLVGFYCLLTGLLRHDFSFVAEAAGIKPYNNANLPYFSLLGTKLLGGAPS